MVHIPGAESTCWRSGREGTAAFIRGEEGTRPCIKTEFTGRSQRRGRCVTGRVGPDLFVADSAPRCPRSKQTALAKILKPILVRCQGCPSSPTVGHAATRRGLTRRRVPRTGRPAAATRC